METPENNTLVLGIGNYLMGDEGVGVYVAQQLAQTPTPSGLDVLDGGTGGFHLMGVLEDYPFVVMVDATLDGLPAGTIRRIEPRFSADFPRAMSTHDVGLRDVVEALCIRERLPKILLYVVSIEEAKPMHIGLSPAVQAAADAVLEEIRNLPSLFFTAETQSRGGFSQS
ncbi:MAG: hydrogenase maturation protease [Saprospiraceae bacterium]|jgi:hydrogenase maturation protease|nr:hydrogenase maturation protease [Saprospiraceae bacterium]